MRASSGRQMRLTPIFSGSQSLPQEIFGNSHRALLERPGSAPYSARRLWLWRSQSPPPFCPQGARPLWVALVEKPGGGHPVRAEASEVLAQLAPGAQGAAGLHVADRHRPDDALTFAPLLIAIAQRDLPARMDLAAYTRHIEAIGGKVPRRRRFGHWLEHIGPKPLGHDGTALGDQIFRRPRERPIAVARPPLRTQHGCLDLVRSQHQ